MDIKLILTDLDGTLLLPGMGFHEATHEAITRCEQADITVAAVTGRGYNEVKSILKNIGIKGPCVFEGGALVIDTDTDEIMWSQPLEELIVPQVLDILQPYAAEIDWGQGVTTADHIVHDADYPDCFSVWAAVPIEEGEHIVTELNLLPNVTAHGGPKPAGEIDLWGIQITHIAADKFHGVGALLRTRPVARRNVLAIGDGSNDLPLFAAAGTTIAMGNATEVLKKEADYIVSTVEQDGFVEAIDKFILHA